MSLMCLALLVVAASQDVGQDVEKGCARVDFRVKNPKSSEQIAAVADAMRARATKRGLTNARITVAGEHVLAELPEVDRARVPDYVDLLTRSGDVQFRLAATEKMHQEWRPGDPTPEGYQAVVNNPDLQEQGPRFLHGRGTILLSKKSVYFPEAIESTIMRESDSGSWSVGFLLSDGGQRAFIREARDQQPLVGKDLPAWMMVLLIDAKVVGCLEVYEGRTREEEVVEMLPRAKAEGVATLLLCGPLPASVEAVDRLFLSHDADKKRIWTAPPTSAEDAQGWEKYQRPIILLGENVAKLAPGSDTPEAVLVHFFASWIRGDKRWKESLQEAWSEGLLGMLEQMGKSRIDEVRILKRRRLLPGAYQFSIRYFADGSEDGVKDESWEARRVQGQWYVMRAPE